MLKGSSDFSGRGFLGLPQKGISVMTEHFVSSEPSAIHQGTSNRGQSDTNVPISTNLYGTHQHMSSKHTVEIIGCPFDQ